MPRPKKDKLTLKLIKERYYLNRLLLLEDHTKVDAVEAWVYVDWLVERVEQLEYILDPDKGGFTCPECERPINLSDLYCAHINCVREL